MKRESLFQKFNSGESGLSAQEAKIRLEQYGPNSLPEAKPPSALSIFFRQFKSPLIYILVCAAVVVFFMGKKIDSLVITAVFFLNAIIGAIQEGKAQNTLRALKTFTTTNATVLRDEREVIVPDSELVPGDIITLKEGDKVPADARLIHAQSLKVDEAALTGESEAVMKDAAASVRKEASTGDQKNMVFKGTFITGGEAVALVVSTGVHTIIGAISVELKDIDSEVPLKANIRTLSRVIIIVVLSVCVSLFILGRLQGFDSSSMFSIAVAVAVASIPEGLPVVVTLVLATSVYRMSKRNALVKNLQAVEALGHADIIALDKTGTITLNQMMVAEVYTGGEYFEVRGNGYEPRGEIFKDGVQVEPLDNQGLVLTGKAAALTASAHYAYSEENKVWQRVSGDSTEVALAVYAKKIGFSKEALESEYKRVFEVPFDSDLKYHAAVFEEGGQNRLFAAGAPEVLVENAKYLWTEDGRIEIGEKEREMLHDEIDRMSSKGLRVLAVAENTDAPEAFDPANLPALTIISLVGIMDAIRQEARGAVERARQAGIRAVMITGDYVTTAKAIARSVGIYADGDEVLTGADLESMTEPEIISRIGKVTVFARVTPRHKMDIIRAYKKAGLTISMTGDGVNDALSLAAADLGVSMGKGGTEVAREASDIVLLDDNFGSIVSAIEEGRSIYRTIKKVILYLFSTSLGEVLAISGAVLAGWALPLTASQIIWLNFVTDGFLVVALAMEPKDRHLLSGAMTKGERRIVDGTMAVRLVLMGFTMMVGALFLFSRYSFDLALASTMALSVLAVFQWFNVLNVRSAVKSVFTMSLRSNYYLLGALAVVITMQMLAVYTPLMQSILSTVPLLPRHWFEIVLVALSIIAVDEIYKLFRRAFARFWK